MRRRRAIRRHYEPRISQGRENYDVVDWSSRHAQQVRFEVLARCVPPAGKSLLDVGCGLGDLLTFLNDRGLEVDYCGVDLLERMVVAARRQHPGACFVCADVFSPPRGGLPQPLGDAAFDIVFCSGALNLKLDNNREFLPRAVSRMLDLSRRHVVFNLLHKRAEPRYGHCAYHDPDEVLAMLAALPCRARVVEGYLHNDFTVICEKSASS